MTKQEIEKVYNVDLSDEEEKGRLLCALHMTIEAMEKGLVNSEPNIRDRATAKIRLTIQTIKGE